MSAGAEATVGDLLGRLRAALHQVETARAVRESMLRPTDLVYEVAAKLARGR